ncbi:hypothetical protein GCM10028791_38080 [Echinicola sediminis]
MLLLGCGPASESPSVVFPKAVSIENDRFVDDQGREILLNGINVVSKSKADNYLFQSGPEFYAGLKQWGFNSIRFILIWDGLEPEPDQYDEDYLKEVDKRIQWAAENGVFVVLDMHQDLFSAKYADGAPEWATLEGGLPHVTGDVWSDAYLISPAVQQAFDSFWNNSPAKDGKGLQEHYAELWELLAKRYKDTPNVIGYDIMNEPFPGSMAQAAMPAILQAFGEWFYKKNGTVLSEEQLLEIWGNAESRTGALQDLNSKEDFSAVIDALYPIAAKFEKEKLQPFYQKVANTIREIDQEKILFLEHTYFGNMGVKSSIERTVLPNGQPDSLVAYAPHGYDLVVDTDQAEEASTLRIDFIMERIKNTGKRLQMPVWLGEWGAYYGGGDEIVPVAKHTMGQIEQHLFSNAYWSYDPGAENLSYFQKVIMRPYPVCVSGRLLSYKNDADNKRFEVSWEVDTSEDTGSLFYFPDIHRIPKDYLEKINGNIIEIPESTAGYLHLEVAEDEKVAHFSIPLNE